MLSRLRAFFPPSLQGSADTAAFLGLAGCIALSLVSVAASQILLALALVASLRLLPSRKNALAPLKQALLPLVLFCAWEMLAALMAPNVGLALVSAKKFYLFLILPLVPLIARGEKRLLWIYRAVFTVALLSSLVGIIQYFTDPMSRDLMHRITGSLSQWMTYSGSLMLSLILLAACALRASLKKFLLWIPAAVLISLAIVLSLTRSTVLGACVGIFAMLFLAILVEKQKRFLAFFICLVLFSAALFIAAPASIQQRFRSGLNLHDPNTRNRIATFDTSIRMIQANPWFGVGTKNVQSEAMKYRTEHEFPDWLYQHMHDNVLQIAVATGIPGLLLWLWFMLRLAWDALRTYRYSRSDAFPYGEQERGEAALVAWAALGCWIALMVAGLFEYNFGDSEVLTLFLFTVGAPYVYAPGGSRSA